TFLVFFNCANSYTQTKKEKQFYLDSLKSLLTTEELDSLQNEMNWLFGEETPKNILNVAVSLSNGQINKKSSTNYNSTILKAF
ncbi:hypothetical protein, partial [Listeria monocytogenes]|uniref:hypothetical protein n=1 Tax=Listeria monocytogenes TaxID=1639 RepID=UPI002FDC1956